MRSEPPLRSSSPGLRLPQHFAPRPSAPMTLKGKESQPWSYSITDITELVHYHSLLSVLDDETADNNLRRLVQKIEGLATTPLWRPAEWAVCDRCGTSVDTVLIHPDGHHYSDDGDFYCADCWEIEI